MSGYLRIDTLLRLSEVLFDVSGSIGYEVNGETVGENAFLELKLGGPLSLTCQRCLGPLEFVLSVRRRIVLVPPGVPWPEDGQDGGLDDEVCDAVESSRQMNLAALLEDEALLALPIAPRHARCEMPIAGSGLKDASPFAQLARLKRN